MLFGSYLAYMMHDGGHIARCKNKTRFQIKVLRELANGPRPHTIREQAGSWPLIMNVEISLELQASSLERREEQREECLVKVW
jgi:hypothetical protein